LSKETLEHERRIVLDEIQRKRSKPEYLWSLVEESLYAIPYGLPVLGRSDVISSLDVRALRRHLNTVLTPSRIRMVLAGKAGPEVSAMIAETFGLWNGTYASCEPPPLEVAPRLLAIPGSGPRIGLYLAFPAPALPDRDRLGVEVLAQLLGRGFRSRIFQKLREESGLAYAVGGGSVHMRRTGYIYLAAELDRNRLREGYGRLMQTVREIGRRAPESDEVAEARETIALRVLQEAEGLGLAHQLGLHWLAGDIYYASRAAAAYRRVSREMVQEAATYLDPSGMAIVGVGLTEETIADLLEVLI
jgi:predicted Zn-dependent peptidase